MSPEGWTRYFIDKLIQITQKQWIYQNYKMNFQTKGGLTIKETNEIFDRPRYLLCTDPDDMLPQHQHMFMVDAEELGEGPLANKQVWILRMKAEKT